MVMSRELYLKKKQLPFALEEKKKAMTLVSILPCLTKFGHTTATSSEVRNVNQSVGF